MRVEKNYYEVMGLPRDATAEQIKKRYRELARKYHPDVVKDKAFGQRMFVEITEAYKTLVDPNKRASYDLSLPSASEESHHRTPHSHGASNRTTASGGTRRTGSSGGVDTLIRDARFSFIKGRLNEATNLCRMVLDIDQKNAKAHSILGDIYTAQRKVEKAVMEYSYAVQYDPRDKESQEKLDRLASGDRAERVRRGYVETGARMRSMLPDKQTVLANTIGWPLVFGILVLSRLIPEAPIDSLRVYMPLINQWSWNLVIALGLSSGLGAALMMISGMLGHPDEELILEDAGFFPLGLPLMIFSVLFFWGAAAFYLFFSGIQGHISKSVVKVFGVVAAVVLIAGFLYPMGSDQVWLFGGNVAFVGALAGWYGAAAMRPLGE